MRWRGHGPGLGAVGPFVGLVLAGLSAAACSPGSATSPSTAAEGSGLTSSAASAGALGADTAGGSSPTTPPSTPATASAVPQFSVNGIANPHGCVPASSATSLEWTLSLADAGDRPLRLVTMTHHDDASGCEATVRRPRMRVVITGPNDFAPHAAGVSRLSFDAAQYRCGRVQVDASLIDAAGNSTLIVGAVVDYGTSCAPSAPLTCSMRNAVNYAPPGIPAVFDASGGDGTYRWSTPGGAPADGSGPTFTTNYWRSGNFTATVTSDDQTATCDVVAVPLSNCNQCLLSACQPYYQYVGVHRPVTFTGLTTLTGEPTFTWRAPGGSPASGSAAAGSTFTTSFAQEGFYTLDVSTSQRTWSCIVSVVPPGFAP